ncbi:MAG: hypothetical protein MJZ30_11580 [Paludibacteraceae bacterium]|nr:hypothetical protein [Paludibacteraceae bacterium]
MEEKATFENGLLQEIIDNFEMYDEHEIKSILEQHGASIRFCDSGIDDGCDEDEEDSYVMYSSCDITDCNRKTRSFKFYYGDVTSVIGWIREY